VTSPDAFIRRMAAGDPTGWYEPLYASGAAIPWDRSEPQRLLVEWSSSGRDGTGKTALVVGCGFGRDAEYLAGLGYATTAFDISPTAVRAARSRHPESTVDYVTADLFDPPADWLDRYDLVVESMTVQSMPDPPRAAAIASVGRLVAPGGTLVVVAFAGPEVDEGPPWPLSRAEIDAFAVGELRPVRVERIPDLADPTTSRWRAEFVR
jgi:SAM-dependent methyltransferase